MLGLDQLSVLHALLRHPRVGRDAIVAFQNARLRRLVAHAYENVPYYRRVFDQSEVTPEDVRTVADLPRIPISSKRDLQGLPVQDIVARGVDPASLVVHQTSGSTGMPAVIRRTGSEERLLGAFRLRALRQLGWHLRDRRAQLMLPRPAHYRVNQLPIRLLASAGRYRLLDCRYPPDQIAAMLRQYRPTVIGGYAGVLAQVAQVAAADDLDTIRPRFVLVGGDVCTPSMREQIAAAFRAPVREWYGSYEFNLVAWQCRETGDLHTCDDGMIVEVLRDGRPVGPGEQGELVGTNLHAWASPYIRFRLGDLVTSGGTGCPCGQPFATIRAVQGRMADYLLLPDGRRIHPFELVLLLRERAPWIRDFRFIQERESRIVVRVVPVAAPSARELAVMREPIAALLGATVELAVEVVPELMLDPSGKSRVSRSLVSSMYDAAPPPGASETH